MSALGESLTRGGEKLVGLAKEPYWLTRGAFDLYRCYRHWKQEERRTKRLSLAELRAAQWPRVRKMLSFVYDNIPVYRTKFEEAGLTPDDIEGPDDLARLPVLTKDEIRRNFPDRMLAAGRRYPRYMLGQTSGSTADSLHFVRPERIWHRLLYYAMFCGARGLPDAPILFLTTPVCTPTTCSLDEAHEEVYLLGRVLHRLPGLRHLGGAIGLPSSENVLTASPDYFENLRSQIASLPPAVIVADPVYLGALARYLRRTGRSIPRPKLIITTFELLTGSLEDLLREVFDCRILIQYGASEVQGIADACEHGRLHLRMDLIHLEVVNRDGPVQPGEVGRALITDLDNFNMPLIRYEIGDLLRTADGTCACGRNSESFVRVEGRAIDTLHRDGNGFLTHYGADEIFRGQPGIAAYQLVQEAPDRFRLEILPDEEERLEPEEILRRCRAALGEEADVRLRCVKRLKPLPSNKYRFVYSTDGAPESLAAGA